jgi:hypothetical protein
LQKPAEDGDMKTKSILRTLLLIFVAVSGLFLVIKDVRERSQSRSAADGSILAASSPASDSAKEGRHAPNSPKVIAYYFHTTFRCSSCRKIEAYSHEAIESGFSKELKDGTLEWRVINVEESGNRHFVDDYRLFTKSLILVRLNNGKQKEWKNLMKVWELLRNKEAFVRYVQDELRSYLVAS